jgi:serpin B
MKRPIALGLALFVIVFVLPQPMPGRGQVPSADTQAVVVGNTAFATDLYGRLKNEKGNLFLSPYSISTALAMTLAGARGETAEQMAKVLHFGLPQERLPPTFASLEAELDAIQKRGEVQLSIANSLWPQKGHPFLPEYVGLLKQYYGTSVTPLDYAGAAEAARNTINDWVDAKTNHKITDLIGPGVLGRETLLVLANAIYFKGDWAAQFDPKQTTVQPFHVASDKDVKCQLMTHAGAYAYAETSGLQVLELSYAGDDLSMIVLLPQKTDGIGALERELTASKLAEWTKALRQRRVEVFLPKFKLSSMFSLKEILVAMGMADAFSGKADFSGMDGTHTFVISALLHKAFVDLNEEGTEAAAATGVVVTTAMFEQIPVFRADHPFIFLIRDKHNGSILFLGRLTDPSS